MTDEEKIQQHVRELERIGDQITAIMGVFGSVEDVVQSLVDAGVEEREARGIIAAVSLGSGKEGTT